MLCELGCFSAQDHVALSDHAAYCRVVIKHDASSVRVHSTMEFGSGSSVTGRWAMEVLVIVALVCVIYEEGVRSYGFATHVWETGGRISRESTLRVDGEGGLRV